MHTVLIKSSSYFQDGVEKRVVLNTELPISF